MWRTHLIIHLLYVSVGRSHLRNNTSRDEVELQRKIDEILEGEGYNNGVRPTNEMKNNKPVSRFCNTYTPLLNSSQAYTVPTVSASPSRENATVVFVDVAVNALGPVNDRDMKLGASFYLRQEWLDPRLQIPDFNGTVVLSYKQVKGLWVPDLFFPQSETEIRHEITTPNVLLRLGSDGNVFYSQRLTVVFQCSMNLHKFPMDEQTCHIRMESYTFTTDDIIMKWSEERQSLNVLPDVNMPDFELINYTTHDCTSKYATGEFPCLYAKLTLKRQIGYYLTQTYIPSILIVTLSWISFWIDLQAIPARISVGLLTVLTITTQSTGAIAQLPRVPYIKSIDVWLSSCLVFVFAAYMEYAVVIVMARRHRKGTLSEQKQSPVSDAISDGVDNTGFDADGSYIGDCQPPTLKKKLSEQLKTGDRDLGVTIDKFSRQAFPAAFVLFNAVYWTYYRVLT